MLQDAPQATTASSSLPGSRLLLSRTSAVPAVQHGPLATEPLHSEELAVRYYLPSLPRFPQRRGSFSAGPKRRSRDSSECPAKRLSGEEGTPLQQVNASSQEGKGASSDGVLPKACGVSAPQPRRQARSGQTLRGCRGAQHQESALRLLWARGSGSNSSGARDRPGRAWLPRTGRLKEVLMEEEEEAGCGQPLRRREGLAGYPSDLPAAHRPQTPARHWIQQERRRKRNRPPCSSGGAARRTSSRRRLRSGAQEAPLNPKPIGTLLEAANDFFPGTRDASQGAGGRERGAIREPRSSSISKSGGGGNSRPPGSLPPLLNGCGAAASNAAAPARLQRPSSGLAIGRGARHSAHSSSSCPDRFSGVAERPAGWRARTGLFRSHQSSPRRHRVLPAERCHLTPLPEACLDPAPPPLWVCGKSFPNCSLRNSSPPSCSEKTPCGQGEKVPLSTTLFSGSFLRRFWLSSFP